MLSWCAKLRQSIDHDSKWRVCIPMPSTYADVYSGLLSEDTGKSSTVSNTSTVGNTCTLSNTSTVNYASKTGSYSSLDDISLPTPSSSSCDIQCYNNSVFAVSSASKKQTTSQTVPSRNNKLDLNISKYSDIFKVDFSSKPFSSPSPQNQRTSSQAFKLNDNISSTDESSLPLHNPDANIHTLSNFPDSHVLDCVDGTFHSSRGHTIPDSVCLTQKTTNRTSSFMESKKSNHLNGSYPTMSILLTYCHQSHTKTLSTKFHFYTLSLMHCFILRDILG